MDPLHIDAIRAFAGANGQHWKAKLHHAYECGKDERMPNGALLRWIRNRYTWAEISTCLDAPKPVRKRRPMSRAAAEMFERQRQADHVDGFDRDDLGESQPGDPA